ncbi:unnamed protein product [Rotaria sp. Silwood1]|nr:unnamed protein product [Rotaria sp. Silwood1]CAF1649580.1 unnamed protein product [Rotaria sp. Silwood1]
MNDARYVHTASVLSNGRVLVAGGCNTAGGYLNSAELYDPSTGLWTYTGYMSYLRSQHTASLLTNGQVLIAGGFFYSGYGPTSFLNSAELYDPLTGVWANTGNMAVARIYHTATLLINGTVLITGGYGFGGFWNSAELYDPSAGVWTLTGSMKVARDYHTATLLANGQVLVAGGTVYSSYGYSGGLNSAELYDPSTGVWTYTGNMAAIRSYHTATLLTNGYVLVVGGLGIGGYLNSAELYDPSTGVWTSTGNTSFGRYLHTATLLDDGKVLVVGGVVSSSFRHSDYLNSTELYDPSTGVWTNASILNFGRMYHTASILTDEKVLVAGGYDYGGALNSAELYG